MMTFKLVTCLFLAFISFTTLSCDFDPPSSEVTGPLEINQPDIFNSIFNVATAETRLVKLVNEQRLQHGKLPLLLRLDLALVASKHSEDMRDRNFFAHVNPEEMTYPVVRKHLVLSMALLVRILHGLPFLQRIRLTLCRML